jgi:hypothetical protein
MRAENNQLRRRVRGYVRQRKMEDEIGVSNTMMFETNNNYSWSAKVTFNFGMFLNGKEINYTLSSLMVDTGADVSFLILPDLTFKKLVKAFDNNNIRYTDRETNLGGKHQVICPYVLIETMGHIYRFEQVVVIIGQASTAKISLVGDTGGVIGRQNILINNDDIHSLFINK